MIFRPTRKGGGGAFDMTPMIDVVLQLIIFFMYTAQFSQVTRTLIDLPAEAGEAEAEIEPRGIIVDVRIDGTLLVEREEISIEQFLTMVEAEAGRRGSAEGVDLLVRADRNAPMAHVNRLARRLTEMGVRNWRLATSEQPRP